MSRSKFPGIALSGMASAFLLTVIGSYSVSAQQAPLPPGTSAPDSSVPATPPTPPRTQPQTPLADAEGNIALQNYDKARSLLLPWLSAHPTDARALFDLGYLEDAENHPDAALADYKKSIAANTMRFESHLSLGLLLAREGHPQEAQEQLTTAITLQPDPPNPTAQAQAYRALARLERTTDPVAAKEHLLDALHLGPEQPDDLLLTAEIATANEDDETAEAAYRQLLTRQPESSDATAGLVHLLLKEKKYSEAEPLLRTALSRDPDNPALNSQLASTLTYEGKKDEALAILQKLYTLKPDDPLIGGMLADAYTQNGNPEKGEPILVDLLKKYPQNADLLNSRAENLLQEHRYPEAIAAFQAALKLSPENPDDWMQLAIAASMDKQYPLVLQSLSMRAKFADENPGSNFLRATAYDNLHQKKEAVEYYKKFLAVSAGKFPDQEWEAQHRLIALEPKSN
jgi:tetratricopeptide (TPR) repeat protein